MTKQKLDKETHCFEAWTVAVSSSPMADQEKKTSLYMFQHINSAIFCLVSCELKLEGTFLHQTGCSKL